MHTLPRTIVVLIFAVRFLCHNTVSTAQQSFTHLNSNINGTVYRSIGYRSEITGSTLMYSVYLPPFYYSSADSFPVLYLLHGYGGSETSWIDRCNIHVIIDSLIRSGDIPPMIVIMPDAKNSYYINDCEGRFPYEDIFIKELLPFVDSTYKTCSGRANRIIGGLSMGGYGAVIYSILHHEYFATCIALSSAIRSDEMILNQRQDDYNNKFGPLYGNGLVGEERLTELWKSYNPLYMINDSVAGILKSINWYIDCGTDDFLLPGNEMLHQLFLKYNIPHEYHVRIGAHNWEYWRAGIIDGFKFAGRKLIRLAANPANYRSIPAAL
jgi:enterochelin esterase-like enzyme